MSETWWWLLGAGVLAVVTAIAFAYRFEEWVFNYPKVRQKNDDGV